MDVSQALDIINTVKQPQAKALSDLIPLDLIEQAYQMSDTVTLRTRKLSLESLVWLLVGMALYNDKSISDVVNQLDIVDREGVLYESALTQRRKTLGKVCKGGVHT